MALALQLMTGSAPPCRRCDEEQLRRCGVRSGDGRWLGNGRVAGGIPDLRRRRVRRRVAVACHGRAAVAEAQARVDYGGQIRGGVEVPVTCYQVGNLALLFRSCCSCCSF